MECIDDISEPEDMESCEWFIKKPFDANDFIEVINIFACIINHFCINNYHYCFITI